MHVSVPQKCLGNDASHYKAEARFDQSLNAHKSSNEDNRIAYSKTGNNTLNVICVVEEET